MQGARVGRRAVGRREVDSHCEVQLGAALNVVQERVLPGGREKYGDYSGRGFSLQQVSE